MNTPTPGDLSARHATTLKTMIHQRKDGDPCVCAECRALLAAIAALSALPAAGGEIAGEVVAFEFDNYRACVAFEEGSRPPVGTKIYATPQPSAAEGECTNCGRPKRADRAIDACACASLTYTPPPDAAVGAQGEGENWLSALGALVCAGKDRDASREDQEADINKAHAELYGAIRRLATPTSGGVDDYVDADEVFLSQGADDVPCLQVPGRIIARFIPGSWDRAYNLFSGNTPAAPAAGKGVDDVLAIVARYVGKTGSIYRYIAQDLAIARVGAELADEAALTRQPVAGDGMVLVPREPTEAMRAAGKEAHYEAETRAQHEWDMAKAGMSWRENRAAHVYAAMLAAAPAATPTDGGEGS